MLLDVQRCHSGGAGPRCQLVLTMPTTQGEPDGPPARDPSAVAADLARLHAEFPGYRIWHEITGNRARLVAVRRYHGTGPHTVVTADPAELRAALAASLPPLRPQPLTGGGPNADGE